MALKHLGYGFTNSNGIATLDYDANGNQLANSGYVGTGAGLIQMMACYNEKDTERIIQSETYGIYDCIYYDLMASDTSSRYFYNSTNNTLTYNNEYLEITSNNTGTDLFVDLRSLTDSIKGKTVNFEVELDTNGITGLILRTLNINPLRSITLSDGVNVLENVVVPSDTSGAIFRLVKTNATSGMSFKFKNIKVYPV